MDARPSSRGPPRRRTRARACRRGSSAAGRGCARSRAAPNGRRSTARDRSSHLSRPSDAAAPSHRVHWRAASRPGSSSRPSGRLLSAPLPRGVGLLWMPSSILEWRIRNKKGERREKISTAVQLETAELEKLAGLMAWSGLAR